MPLAADTAVAAEAAKPVITSTGGSGPDIDQAEIDRLLKQAGSNKSKLLKANIWLSDISTFAEMNAEWDAWIVPGSTPARATVESKLAAPIYTVEIMMTVAR